MYMIVGLFYLIFTCDQFCFFCCWTFWRSLFYETLNTGVLSVVRVGRFNMYTCIFNIYIYLYIYTGRTYMCQHSSTCIWLCLPTAYHIKVFLFLLLRVVGQVSASHSSLYSVFLCFRAFVKRETMKISQFSISIRHYDMSLESKRETT